MSVKVIIKDNFFNTDHLKVLETMNLQKIRNDSIKQYNNAINDNLKILSNDVIILELNKEIDAHILRNKIINKNFLTRFIYIFKMIYLGYYSYFNGWKSIVKDFIRL